MAIRKASKWLVVFLALLLGVGTAGIFYTNQLKVMRQQEAEVQSQMEALLEETSSQETVSSEPELEGPVNPLTGLPIEEGRENSRPVAVMINNIKKAQPLLGVQDADLLYECLVEGGITRILAVYQDPQDIPVIGSVRSARPYYIHLASSLDAIYVHVGGSTQARNLLKKDLVTDYDLGSMEQYMWRDPDRRAEMGYEHSAVTSGQRLMEAMDDKRPEPCAKTTWYSRPVFLRNPPSGRDRIPPTLRLRFLPINPRISPTIPRKGAIWFPSLASRRWTGIPSSRYVRKTL